MPHAMWQQMLGVASRLIASEDQASRNCNCVLACESLWRVRPNCINLSI
jgi:hypothetical protein